MMMIDISDVCGLTSQGMDGMPARPSSPLSGPSGRKSTPQTIAETICGTAIGSRMRVRHSPTAGTCFESTTASQRASAICRGFTMTAKSSVTLSEAKKVGSLKM